MRLDPSREALLRAINENLEQYFKTRAYSRLGTRTASSMVGIPYAVFGTTVGREFIDDGLPRIKKWVEEVLMGIRTAIELMKDEGNSYSANKYAVVEWRRFPEISYDTSSFDSERYLISFRVAVYNE